MTGLIGKMRKKFGAVYLIMMGDLYQAWNQDPFPFIENVHTQRVESMLIV